MVDLKEQLIQFFKFLDMIDKKLYDIKVTQVKINDIVYEVVINDIIFNNKRQGYSIGFYDCLNEVEYILDLNNCTFMEIAQGDCIDCICFRKDSDLAEMAYLMYQE